MAAYTCSHIHSDLYLAEQLTLNSCLVSRALLVRYASLHRLLPRTSGPWVRADNTRRVDLVNLPATFAPPPSRFYDFTQISSPISFENLSHVEFD